MDYVEGQGVVIVSNGTFNPSIFHPSWLNANGLITDDEAAAAQLNLVHAEIAQFQIPGVRFDIQTERAAIHGSAEPFVQIMDIWAQLFGRLLPHTILDNVGINYWAHIKLKDWAQRQRLGRLLAPIEPWGEFGQQLESEDKELAGGFSTLSMRAVNIQVSASSAINITLQPSNKLADQSGVFVYINHHYDFDEKKPASDWIETVVDGFDPAIKYSRDIVTHFIELGRST